LTGVPPNSANWTIGGDATPYIEYYKHYVGGNLVSSIAWEYDTTFTDLSGNGNDATPSFITGSSDPHVSAALSSFSPISEAKAPAYTLDDPPAFITTAPAMTGNFTAGALNITAPGWGVIKAVAIKGAVPERLPATLISTFILLTISLSFSYMMMKAKNNNMLIKVAVIFFVMCIFVALGFYDLWQIYFFALIGIGLMWMSRQREVY